MLYLLYSFEASTFAGDATLGDSNTNLVPNKTFSMCNDGRHISSMEQSDPGSWVLGVSSNEIQSWPVLKILG